MLRCSLLKYDTADPDLCDRRLVEKYKVACLYTAPTALRAIRREDPDAKMMAQYDIKSLRSLFLAGERSEPGIVARYQVLLESMAAKGAMVVDNYWSTESGSPITGIQINKAFPPLAVRPGAAGLALPGMDIRVVDDEGKELKRGELGNIVLGTPLPPSALSTVWNNPAKFREAYFARFEKNGGWWDTGDAGVIDDGAFRIGLAICFVADSSVIQLDTFLSSRVETISSMSLVIDSVRA